MLSELIRAIHDSAAMDWQTSEKIAYTVLTYLEEKLPPADFEIIKQHVLGNTEYVLPERTGYPGYRGELPDQARTTPTS